MDRDPRKSVGRLIYVLNRFAGRYAGRVLAPHQIGMEQLLYLGSLIHEGDGVTQETLAARIHVDKSTAARMLAGLERRGLVERRRVPGNVRAYRVLATERAHQLWSSIIPRLWNWQDVLTRGFTPAEREQAIALLKRMEENAAAACAEARRGGAGSARRKDR